MKIGGILRASAAPALDARVPSTGSSRMRSNRSSWPIASATTTSATEHHFLEEYAHSSAPEIFLAACSQRTKNIRIGPRASFRCRR